MIAVLDLQPSRSFWRLVYPPYRTLDETNTVAPPSSCVCNIRDFESLRPKWLTQEVMDLDDGRTHLLTFDRRARRKTENHITRAWSGPIPEGSFFDLGTGVYVCSPAFLFLQTAATHSLAQTIAYGDEICGTYSFDPFEERGMLKRKPLVTIESLTSYLETARSYSGYNRARTALAYMVENSASPAETKDEMLMCLPYHRGGYCIPLPVLNAEVPLTPTAAMIARKSVLYPDLYWENIRLDVEHHGHYDHSGQAKSASDRARVSAFREMGIEVIELTADLVGDLDVFEAITLRVASRLGKRVNTSKLGPTPERVKLRRELFSWNKNGGRKYPPKALPACQATRQ